MGRREQTIATKKQQQQQRIKKKNNTEPFSLSFNTNHTLGPRCGALLPHIRRVHLQGPVCSGRQSHEVMLRDAALPSIRSSSEPDSVLTSPAVDLTYWGLGVAPLKCYVKKKKEEFGRKENIAPKSAHHWKMASVFMRTFEKTWVEVWGVTGQGKKRRMLPGMNLSVPLLVSLSDSLSIPAWGSLRPCVLQRGNQRPLI